jgi:hypothetical protein
MGSDGFRVSMVVVLSGCVRRSGHPKEGAQPAPEAEALAFLGGTRVLAGGAEKAKAEPAQRGS